MNLIQVMFLVCIIGVFYLGGWRLIQVVRMEACTISEMTHDAWRNRLDDVAPKIRNYCEVKLTVGEL